MSRRRLVTENENDIPQDQKVCPKCGAVCTYEVCECPYECFTGKVEQP